MDAQLDLGAASGAAEPVTWSARSIDGAVSSGWSWVRSAAMARLVEALGGPSTASLPEGMFDLVRWSSQTLDTRNGVERQLAQPVTFPDDHIAALLAAAHPLGLMRTDRPRLPEYDLIVVLGGTATANLLRARLAAESQRGGMRVGGIIGLGAPRLLEPHERRTEPSTSGLRTEAEHLRQTMAEAFSIPVRSTTDESDQTYVGSDGRELRILSAPSARPGRRADTRDATRFLLSKIDASARRRVLIVTSAIYASYQFLVIAPLALTGGTKYVELIGTPTASDAPRALLAQRIAQEIHATFATLADLAAPA